MPFHRCDLVAIRDFNRCRNAVKGCGVGYGDLRCSRLSTTFFPPLQLHNHHLRSPQPPRLNHQLSKIPGTSTTHQTAVICYGSIIPSLLLGWAHPTQSHEPTRAQSHWYTSVSVQGSSVGGHTRRHAFDGIQHQPSLEEVFLRTTRV
jgi:hypothetical protein